MMIGGWDSYNPEGKIQVLDLKESQNGWVWEDNPGEFPELKTHHYKRLGHSATLIEGKIFLFGGYWTDNVYKNDLQVLDTAEMTLKEWHYYQGSKPEPRSDHGAASIDDRVFIFGG